MAHGAAESSVFISQMQIHKWLDSVRVAKRSEVKILVTNRLVTPQVALPCLFICNFIYFNFVLECSISCSLIAPQSAVQEKLAPQLSDRCVPRHSTAQTQVETQTYC